MTVNRRLSAYRARVDAAKLARSRAHQDHLANGDEQRFSSASYAMSFTKGLEHDGGTRADRADATGLLANRTHFEAFRSAIDAGEIDAFTSDVPRPAPPGGKAPRKWEAPTAGLAYDLQGPDCQSVTMPPAPPLLDAGGAANPELVFEMAEVYELALIRDEPLTALEQGAGDADVLASLSRLNALGYATSGFPGRPRRAGASGELTLQTVFRGSSPGVEAGPYLSQFLLIGNPDRNKAGSVAGGKIEYGALQVDQRVAKAVEQDYMNTFEAWLEVQDGRDVQANETLFETQSDGSARRRFITTPRDLATYVHYDALYQAYLNACLVLLGMETPFDPGFGNLSGQRGHRGGSRHTGGFALYGGPHILTLVTEVATRALKAVRYQKFNNHIRLRPEALAARVARHSQITSTYPAAGAAFDQFRTALGAVVGEIETHNGPAGPQAVKGDGSALLPMAFQEGSPMHPAYGAGHATVAGACVTVLKAYFDTDAVFACKSAKGFDESKFVTPDNGEYTYAVAFRPTTDGMDLDESVHENGMRLTLEGELNKLAANISIGRNMAGVHFFSDYYDSLRMGEAIAIGLLEEQALCYPTDPFVMSVPTFDGAVRRIGRR